MPQQPARKRKYRRPNPAAEAKFWEQIESAAPIAQAAVNILHLFNPAAAAQARRIGHIIERAQAAAQPPQRPEAIELERQPDGSYSPRK